mgnify:CR=1 FL=1
MTLELEGLTKVYKDKTALDDVSFSFTPGTVSYTHLTLPTTSRV